MKKLIAPRATAHSQPEVIMHGTITALLMDWFSGEQQAEIKAVTLTPHVLRWLQHEHHMGRVTEKELFDAVLDALVGQAQRTVGFASVEIIHAERRDKLRSQQ